MNRNNEVTAISEFMSLVLRHRPAAIGLSLDADGRADVENLLECAATAGHDISRAQLNVVVAASDKRGFALSDDGLRSRAERGHVFFRSANDVWLVDAVPPPFLEVTT